MPRTSVLSLLSLVIMLVVVGCSGAPTASPTSAPAAAASTAPAAAPTTASATVPSTAAAGEVRLTLAAYSTPREAYEAIIPLFQKTPAGAGVAFDQSYGASGDQSRAVEGGLPADLVALSLAPDVTRLVKAKLVAEDWNTNATKGMVTDSVVVIAVRKGNPKHIQTWADLTRSGVEVLTPNPLTSGGARWNVMAAYGAQLKLGKTHEQAVEYLKALFANVVVQDKSARESMQTFAGGKGDVILAYENEAITAQRNKVDLDYVVPDQTILIENPAAVVASSPHPEQAKAFLDYLLTPEAQQVFGQQGYRPVVKATLAEFSYPVPAALFTIDDVGGWTEVQTRFFNSETGIMAEINRSLGVQ